MEAQPPLDLVLVEPDFGQFYMRRAGSEAWDSHPVPSIGYERHLWSSGTFVVVNTVRKYGTTELRVEILDSAPGEPEPEWQHVVEESLVSGGDLEIFDWPGGEPKATVSIPHGTVRLRMGWSGLSEANEFEGLDESGNSDEHLRLQVWPAEPDEPAVLRWWPPLEVPAPSDHSADGRRQIEGLEKVIEALSNLELVRRFDYPYPELIGSIREHSSANALYRDSDGALWADGYDVRRTLRELSEAEAAQLQSSQ